MTTPDSEIKVIERRTQARLCVRTPIRVGVRLDNQLLDATCFNLSWGGLLFELTEPLPRAARVIRVELPWIGEHRIRAEGLVQRAEPSSESAASLVAARFNTLSPRGHARFERLLRLLQNSRHATAHPGPRALVQELRVAISSPK